MSQSSVLGACVGLVAAIGVLLINAHIAGRRIALTRRVEPYLKPSLNKGTEPGLTTVHTPLGVLAQALDPFVVRLDSLLVLFSSPTLELQTRLRRSGNEMSVESFRLRQLQFAVAGLAMGVGTIVLLSLIRPANIAAYLLMVLCGPLVALALCDYLLNRAIRARETRILSQFPTVAELLALAVSAGEGPMAALERIAISVRGDLSKEIAEVVSAVHSGAPLTHALESLGRATQLAPIIRFADGVAVAVERGSPLAQVLRAQAQDAREVGHRELMETGGKKEIAMLVPVVFLLLPITVVFAVFPSFVTFGTGL